MWRARLIVAVYNLKYEIFGENLKIHAGGDDKLRIQFAWPKTSVIELAFERYPEEVDLVDQEFKRMMSLTFCNLIGPPRSVHECCSGPWEQSGIETVGVHAGKIARHRKL